MMLYWLGLEYYNNNNINWYFFSNQTLMLQNCMNRIVKIRLKNVTLFLVFKPWFKYLPIHCLALNKTFLLINNTNCNGKKRVKIN